MLAVTLACVTGVHADQSILVRSQTSATAISAGGSQPVSAASETVRSQFTAVGGQSATAASTNESGAIKLKWRARHPNSFVLNGAGQKSPVQQATQITELNTASPFDDPFEDRTPGRFTSTLNQPDDSEYRGAEGLQPDERFLAPPAPNCANCPEKCYNGRDCCDESERCSYAQKLIREYGIMGIRLNISPTIKPEEKNLEKLNAYRDEQLIQAEARAWRDTKGNVLAEGALVDYSNNRVYVATNDGETKKLTYDELSDDDRCFVAAWWKIPPSCRLGTEEYVARAHVPITMTWTASQVCHKPLYFEEIALERYGHTSGPIIQPWLSGAHFFANIAIFPYKVGINPLGECQYDLGYYRPGNCAPWLIPPVPLSPRGALFQAGAVTGVSYLIP